MPAAEHEHVDERTIPAVVCARDVGFDARLEVELRLLELGREPLEQVIGFDARCTAWA